MLKLLFFAFLLAHQSTCKPFAQDSLVVYSKTTTSPATTYGAQLWEYSSDGALLQTIALPGYLVEDKAYGRISLDQNGQILAIPVLQGTAGQSPVNLPRVALTMDSEGNIVDKTSVTGAGNGDPTFNGVAVNGQDLWMCLGRELSYITRGATSRIVNNVISGSSFNDLFQTQIVGDTLYFVQYQPNSNTLWKVNPIPLVTSAAVQMVPDTGSFGASNVFFYSSSVVYVSTTLESHLSKYTFVGATLHLEYFALEICDSVVAKQSGSKLFVFALNSGTGEIIRYTDSGSDLAERTVIVSGMVSFQARSIALSPQPTCSDSMLNQDETDVDCGGSKCSTCVDGKTCYVNGDCSSGYCNPDKKCSTPSCSDGWKNQDESDIDCGGATCNKCADGKVCNGNSDCSSKVCNGSSLCAVPACDDTVMNGIETDVDCGGDCTTKCAQSKSCVIDGDCLSKNCLNNVCEMSCFDGFKNQNETDIDCGGVCGATCDNNKSCLQDTDCVNAYCNPESVCSNPTCSDGWMNQDETDVDCGGSCVTLCLNGKNCKVDADCQSGSCNSVCVDPPVAPPQSTPIDTPQANNEPSSSSTPSDSTTPTGITTPASRTPRGKLVSSAIVNVRDYLMALGLLLVVLV